MSRRGPRALVVALALLAVAPATGQAHGEAGGATAYRSEVTAAPAGVAARILGGDDRLELRRDGAREVLVLGYQGEPFLRLDAEGVWRNERSLAARLADERLPAETALDDPVGETPAPEWRRIGSGTTVTYHDHRVHWMASIPPAAVRAAPDERRRLSDWTIAVVVDGTPGAVAGRLDYVPPPRSAAWWIATAAAVLGGAALGLRARRRWTARVAAAVAFAALLALDVGAAHADGTGVVAPALTVLVPAALAGAIAWWARRDAVYETTALALAALVVTALPVVGRLGAAFDYGVLASALPEPATRALLLLVLGATATSIAACGAAWRRALAAPGRMADARERPVRS